jgi:starvation-inducible DNA-binding protein
MLRQLAADQETVVRAARALMPLAERAGDVGTGDLLARRILAHEKAAWMLRSHFA